MLSARNRMEYTDALLSLGLARDIDHLHVNSTLYIFRIF